ncbi:MAG: hypothetical protein LUD00_11090 [Prevotellaceae bacterium]|nr:hypothetical protein [Prevotellaceae bacterium]
MIKTCKSIIRSAHFDIQTFTVMFLVMMLIQIIPIEGSGISYLKVGFMSVAIFFAFKYIKYSGKALFFALLYYLIAFLCVYSASHNLRYSTVIYLGFFLFGYCGFYGLLHKNVLSLSQAIYTIRNILYAFTIILIYQQICTLVGFRKQEFTNICWDFENVYKLNSLSLEPSHAGRVFGCLVLAYLKLDGLVHKYSGIKDFYRNNRKICLASIYTFITMGSTTSLLILLLIIMYFIQKKYLVYIGTIFIVLVVALPTIEYEPVQRALAVLDAVSTGHQDVIEDTDGSASVRTFVYFNTFDQFNPFDAKYWFGHGIENIKKDFSEGYWHIESNQIGGIYQYGFLPFLLSLLFVYKFGIRFLSLENLIFILFLGAGFGNIAYQWGCIMIFTMIRFYENKHGIISKI